MDQTKWVHGYGQRYNHLVKNYTPGPLGLSTVHFLCGSQSEYVPYDYEDGHYKRCPKCEEKKMDQDELDYVKDKIMYEGLKTSIGKTLCAACFDLSHSTDCGLSDFKEKIISAKELIRDAEQLYEVFLKIPPFAGREPKE